MKNSQTFQFDLFGSKWETNRQTKFIFINGEFMASQPTPANDQQLEDSNAKISPVSKEVVIGLVGHAGAGTSIAGNRIRVLLQDEDYEIHIIKFSELIASIDMQPIPEVEEGKQEGETRFQRACALQDRGDKIRQNYRNDALAVAAIDMITKLRGDTKPGEAKKAYLLDSLKHPDEVSLLREVYDHSFRLIAVHCDQKKREDRLIGDPKDGVKYAGAKKESVISFMMRDSKDSGRSFGQRVRDAFHLSDFFLDNSENSAKGAGMNSDLNRFICLILGNDLVRPNASERAIYSAYSSSLQSACLSRQVGAALVAEDGRIISTGTNDPPKFGGGIYDEDSKPDNRCFAWKFESGDLDFVGCHNDRRKNELYTQMGEWLAQKLAPLVADKFVPPKMAGDKDLAEEQRLKITEELETIFRKSSSSLSSMPGVKDAIEYSRAIHAEMDALLAASRIGVSPVGASLYVTTFPCHNCARHLVAAGIKRVFYIEPYIKSLAFDLHYDSITGDSSSKEKRLILSPFTGVGPRMFEDFFVKRDNLKRIGGEYQPPSAGLPFHAVRLKELEAVERVAVELLPELGAGNDSQKEN